ncbi:MAG: SDR family oxidoreductase [Hyphomicrobiales bacterium]
MNHILFFGFGFSAQALAARLPAAQWKITGTSRTAEGAAAIRAMGYEGLVFASHATVPDSVTHVVSSVPPDQAGDPVLRHYGASLAARATHLTWAAYLSTTGVYGDHAGGWVSEDTALKPNTERGHRRLAAEQDWLKLWRDHHLPLHIFRLAGIYGPGRNALDQLRAGKARRIIKPGQIFSRIHVEDIAGLLLASMARPNPGAAYNGADDEPCPPQDVIAHAANLLHLPPPPDVPFAEADLSPMARSFYEDSKRVSNARARTELGYRFRYPNYREGLRALLTS